jgi:mRNA interferase RelE/StbE
VAYQVEVSSRIEKDLARFPAKERSRILAIFRALAEEPRPVGCVPVRLAAKGTYRVRVSDYRVIYVVHDDKRLIVIARVARRGEDTYKDLG